MSKSLKDALMKAGLRSTKTENDRSKNSGKGRVQKKSEKHQMTRNFCECCQRHLPDVEKFKHRNPTISAEWICVGCADKNLIDDQFRITNQSDFAKTGSYRRYYGATKIFQKFVTNENQGGRGRNKKFQNDRNINGNSARKKPRPKKSFNDDDDDNRFNR